MRYFKKAFTMIELIFVIVIMGILAKFGVEFLAQAYKSFINSKINNELQSNSQYALDIIATRMSYRIKPSMIARENNGDFKTLYGYDGNSTKYEWISYDIDGYRGDTNSTWSGVLDLNASKTNKDQLTSLNTDTTKVNAIINALSYGTKGINDSAISFFTHEDQIMDMKKWGWDGNVTLFDTQSSVHIHPIKSHETNTSLFLPAPKINGTANDFNGVEASEYYWLAWTAYAVTIEDLDTSTGAGDLTLWYNYQPWKGQSYTDGNSTIIMENASNFSITIQYKKDIFSTENVNIKVCAKSLLLSDEEHAICKDKNIF